MSTAQFEFGQVIMIVGKILADLRPSCAGMTNRAIAREFIVRYNRAE